MTPLAPSPTLEIVRENGLRYRQRVRTPQAPLEGQLTVVRAATDDDIDLLVAWHSNPEVARYWDDETYTRDEMLARLRRPHVDGYVVMERDEPVGYVQVWFDGQPEGESGIDMFLVPTARDRGLGPDAARTLANWLTSAGGLRLVTADPHVSNRRAVAAWKKAGFQPIEDRGPDEHHTERWLVMQFAASP